MHQERQAERLRLAGGPGRRLAALLIAGWFVLLVGLVLGAALGTLGLLGFLYWRFTLRRVAAVAVALLPTMVVIYLAMTLFVLVLHAGDICDCAVLEALEEHVVLLRLLSERGSDQAITVRIGTENAVASMTDAVP